jgi:predicted DNA-binding transcriptional regulator AlpA
MTQTDRLLNKAEVTDITGLSIRTIDGLEGAGHFPCRRQITPHRVGWLSSEIQDWLQRLPTPKNERSKGC